MFEDMRSRRELRREIEASDLPDATKRVLGFFADPIGSVVELAVQHAERNTEGEA
jgi:hypothetical protein